MRRYIRTVTISREFALDIVRVAIEEGVKESVKVAATVVDPALVLVAYLRDDAITPHSIETSRRKAQTAASTRRPTGSIPEALASILSAGTGNILTNIQGGFPLIVDGNLIGGLGIAGGAPEQDAQVGRNILMRLGLLN